MGAHADQAQVAIYFTPHQDDETLTFTGGITRDLAAGKHVIVVLVTDGSGSWVRTGLANRGYALTSAQFVAARDAEFQAANADLGVSDVHEEGYADGGVSVGVAQDVISRWAQQYPTATLNTMSWQDAQPDHAHLGQALNSMTDLAPRSVFWQNRQYLGLGRGDTLVPFDAVLYAKAAAEYRLWSPSTGRFAIGYTSVPDTFKRVAANPQAGTHGPQRGLTARRYRMAYVMAWRWLLHHR